MSDQAGHKRLVPFFGLRAYGAAAAPLFFVYDLLVPLLQEVLGNAALSIGALMFILLGATALSLKDTTCRRLDPEAKDSEIRAFKQISAVIVALGVIWLTLTFSAMGGETKQNGVIATIFPGFQAFQDRLFGQLDDIQQDVSETRKSVDRLVSLAEDEATNPEKQFGAMGIERSETEFRRAIARGDAKVVNLFLATGWPVSAAMLETFIGGEFVFMAPRERRFTPAVAGALLDSADNLDRRICAPVVIADGDVPGHKVAGGFFAQSTKDPEAIGFYKSLCGDALATHIDRLIASEAARAQRNAAAAQAAQESYRNCMAGQSNDVLNRTRCEGQMRLETSALFVAPQTRDFGPELRAFRQAL